MQEVISSKVQALTPSKSFQVFAAIGLGLALIFLVGFTDIAHNAAHDTRHAFAFPCH